MPPRVALPSDRTPPPPPAADRAAQEDEGQPWWVWLLVLAVLLLGMIGFLGAQVLGGLGPDASPSPTPQQITLPDWGATRSPPSGGRGPPRPGARRGAEPSDEFARNRVISTDPEAGSAVSEGDTVAVVVSSGAEQVPVPNLIGQTAQRGDSRP